MKVETDLTRWDYFVIQTHLNIIPRRKSNWVGIFIWVCVFFVILTPFDCVGDAGELDVSCVLSSVLSSILYTISLFFALFFLIVFLSALFAKPTGGRVGKREFLLEENGILEKTESKEELTKWIGINSIIKTQKVISIWLLTPRLHVLLPRNCFSSQEAYDEFWNCLHTKWKAHTQASNEDGT